MTARENLNKEKALFSLMGKHYEIDMDKVIRLIAFLIIIYVLIKLFKLS